MEAAVISIVERIKPVEMEKKFNDIVAAAANDYKGTMDAIIDGAKWFEIELMTTFFDFFNACIDKKKEAIEFERMAENVAETSSAEAAAADAAEAGPNNTSPTPAKRGRK